MFTVSAFADEISPDLMLIKGAGGQAIQAMNLALGGHLDIAVRDVVLAIAFYYISGLGISMGFHRYFTHGSYKAKTGLRVALAIAGSLAIEGPVLTWVADHRRHHKYSDREGDPHSPWRYGDDWKALTKGLVYAHVGWLFDPNKTSQEKFSPDHYIDVWDVAARTRVIRIPQDAPGASIVFEPSGQLLLTTTDPREARLWEVATGKPVARFAAGGSLRYESITPQRSKFPKRMGRGTIPVSSASMPPEKPASTCRPPCDTQGKVRTVVYPPTRSQTTSTPRNRSTQPPA